MRADQIYGLLDRTRILITDAISNPLPDAADQDALIHHLQLVRAIYRSAHHAAVQAEAKPKAAP